jgi:hypothetical protein
MHCGTFLLVDSEGFVVIISKAIFKTLGASFEVCKGIFGGTSPCSSDYEIERMYC